MLCFVVHKMMRLFCYSSCYISTAQMMHWKHHIFINRNFDMSIIDKGWYQKKGVSQLSNYGSYSSPNHIHLILVWIMMKLTLIFFYIKNNNETNPGCIFDENLVNFDRPDDIEEIIDNSQTVKRTETLSYKPLPSICNELYSVMKKNN